MAGHRSFDELRRKMSPEQKAAVKERVNVLEKEMLLSELRKQFTNKKDSPEIL